MSHQKSDRLTGIYYSSRFHMKAVCFGLSVLMSLTVGGMPAFSLPPADDVPEEVLRTEIITAARSPIDGKPMSAAEYAQLQAQLQSSPNAPPLDPEVRHLIFLLRVRQLLRTIGLPL